MGCSLGCRNVKGNMHFTTSSQHVCVRALQGLLNPAMPQPQIHKVVCTRTEPASSAHHVGVVQHALHPSRRQLAHLRLAQAPVRGIWPGQREVRLHHQVHLGARLQVHVKECSRGEAHR